MQNRREFLGMMAAGLAGPGPEWRNRQSGMRYRRLGRTGYMVSEVVMGGGGISPDNYDHVLLALDIGLNYLDTAPAYGPSEAGFAKVIQARGRDKFFLNTKVSLWDENRNELYKKIFDSLPEAEQKKLRGLADEEIQRSRAAEPDYFGDYFEGQDVELQAAALCNVMEQKYGDRIDRGKNYRQTILDSVDESLKRLGTDHVDLLMCPHGANTPREVSGYPEVFEAFETLRKAGKVRNLGFSAHTDPAAILRAATKTGVYSAAMIAYNIVNHRYVDSALEEAAKSDFGVISMKTANPVFRIDEHRKPVEPRRVKLIDEAVQGNWKIPQKAYLWNLRNKNLSAVISNMTNARMVMDNVKLPGVNAKLSESYPVTRPPR